MFSKSNAEADRVARRRATSIALQGDVAQDADCRQVAKAVLDKWGRIDALVNNAGTTKFVAHADLEGLSADDILGIFRVNVVGPFQMIRACAPALKEAHGAVVNVSSVASLLGTGSSIAYAASKAALDTMTFSLARALGAGGARQRRRAGLRAHALAGRTRTAPRARRARAALRRAAPLKAAAEPRGRRRRDRLADRGRAPRDRRDHLRRRRHAHRVAALKLFDYIIVGAGSAGCVLANRLTEDRPHAVLLLEAGPRDTDRWIHVPLGYGKLFARTDVNWAYESEPEPTLNGRRIFTPRGKVLGGSSSINGLVYIRGQREDFDGWGMPGLELRRSAAVLQEVGEPERGADDWHGVGGPLEVGDLPDRHELCDAFIDSAAALGIPRNDDFNGAAQEGTGYYQATARNGRRCSTATGYLRPRREAAEPARSRSTRSRRASSSRAGAPSASSSATGRAEQGEAAR